MVASNAVGNGVWRSWLLGIVATMIVAVITNGIVFQRDTREQLATLDLRIKHIETRARDAIIRELHVRDEQIAGLNARINTLEKR